MLKLLSVSAGEIANNFGSDYYSYINYLNGNGQTNKIKLSTNKFKEPIKKAVRVTKISLIISAAGIRRLLRKIKGNRYVSELNESFSEQAKALSYMDRSLYDSDEKIPMDLYKEPMISGPKKSLLRG